MFVELPVAAGQTNGTWVDVAALYAAGNADKESVSAALGHLIWPAGYDQATATLEFAADTAGTEAGALYDTDGVTVVSTITKPTTGRRTTLSPSRFSMVSAVRIVLPAAASGAFTFKVGARKAV